MVMTLFMSSCLAGYKAMFYTIYKNFTITNESNGYYCASNYFSKIFNRDINKLYKIIDKRSF